MQRPDAAPPAGKSRLRELLEDSDYEEDEHAMAAALAPPRVFLRVKQKSSNGAGYSADALALSDYEDNDAEADVDEEADAERAGCARKPAEHWRARDQRISAEKQANNFELNVQYNLTATGDGALFAENQRGGDDAPYSAALATYAIGAALAAFRLPDDLPLNPFSACSKLDQAHCMTRYTNIGDMLLKKLSWAEPPAELVPGRTLNGLGHYAKLALNVHSSNDTRIYCETHTAREIEEALYDACEHARQLRQARVTDENKVKQVAVVVEKGKVTRGAYEEAGGEKGICSGCGARGSVGCPHKKPSVDGKRETCGQFLAEEMYELGAAGRSEHHSDALTDTWAYRNAHAALEHAAGGGALARCNGCRDKVLIFDPIKKKQHNPSDSEKVRHFCGVYTIRLSVEQQAAHLVTLRAAVKDYEATRAGQAAASKEQAAKNKVAKKAAKQAGEEHMAVKKVKKAKTE